MLLNPRDGSLAFGSDEVIADLPPDLRDRVTPETHAAVMEVTTGVHRHVPDAVAELAELRRRMSRALASQGLRAAVAGMHPSATWSETVVSSHPRYRDVSESMRVLARREPTLATHVHVGVATPRAAVGLLNRLRAHLPLLLALSANSPFWQGRATGFSSTRTTLFDAFPRTGVPRSFHGYSDWVRTVDALLRSGAIADPSLLWWDARLQPRLGTVEVRIMDAQTTVEDAAPSRRSSSRWRGSNSSAPTAQGKVAGHQTHRGKPLPSRARRHRGAVHRWRLRSAHPGDRTARADPRRLPPSRQAARLRARTRRIARARGENRRLASTRARPRRRSAPGHRGPRPRLLPRPADGGRSSVRAGPASGLGSVPRRRPRRR